MPAEAGVAPWQWAAATALALCLAVARAADPALFFDDFSYTGIDALRAGGWQLREAPGHPGVPGAAWRADAVQITDDPALRGNRVLRLTAHRRHDRRHGAGAGLSRAQGALRHLRRTCALQRPAGPRRRR